MTTSAVKAYHTILPPKASGKQQVQGNATSTSANSVPLFTGLASDSQPEGLVEVTFEAVTYDCYIRLLAADAVSPSVTANTGMIVKAGQPGVSYWLDVASENHVEFIATGTGYLKWYVSSPDYES